MQLALKDVLLYPNSVSVPLMTNLRTRSKLCCCEIHTYPYTLMDEICQLLLLPSIKPPLLLLCSWC
jgi:hypothetical protein